MRDVGKHELRLGKALIILVGVKVRLQLLQNKILFPP